jgi:hypothetical protein
MLRRGFPPRVPWAWLKARSFDGVGLYPSGMENQAAQQFARADACQRRRAPAALNRYAPIGPEAVPSVTIVILITIWQPETA